MSDQADLLLEEARGWLGQFLDRGIPDSDWPGVEQTYEAINKYLEGE